MECERKTELILVGCRWGLGLSPIEVRGTTRGGKDRQLREPGINNGDEDRVQNIGGSRDPQEGEDP